MSKVGDKILKGAKEAVQIAKGNPISIKDAKVTPSCGCIFCDLNLNPDKNNKHFVQAHSIYPDQWLDCTKKD